MRRRCTGILSVREDRRAVSTASKALLGQRRHGQSLDLLRKNGDFAALRRLSPDREELDGGGAHVRECKIEKCYSEVDIKPCILRVHINYL
ncbi:unnamed protein product [Spirodela intermedia]|uniref:Uncharacterized protein n=2 Tax=Spirodela intermedia TaxID=51605 RepID=A0A7I8JQ19_SPIIN|nr:unnamed protein product [Spirodela intermedia]CAA6672278.1 unnamed protein product [Spirodela intermedia]CAA7401707.1 unnamed protein product [Spirodela intermedia]